MLLALIAASLILLFHAYALGSLVSRFFRTCVSKDWVNKEKETARRIRSAVLNTFSEALDQLSQHARGAARRWFGSRPSLVPSMDLFLPALLILAVGFPLVMQSAGLHFEVRGKVFRGAGSKKQYGNEARIEVHRVEFPAEFGRDLRSTNLNSEIRDLLTQNRTAPGFSCVSVAGALRRQFAGTPEDIEVKYLYRPFERSTWYEWKVIETDPEYRALPELKRTAIKKLFWKRRLELHPDFTRLTGAQRETLFRGFFEDELARGEAPEEPGSNSITDYLAELNTLTPLAETVADAEGRFNLTLAPGSYIILATAGVEKVLQVGGSYYQTPGHAVWARFVRIDADTKVVMGKPLCSPVTSAPRGATSGRLMLEWKDSSSEYQALSKLTKAPETSAQPES